MKHRSCAVGLAVVVLAAAGQVSVPRLAVAASVPLVADTYTSSAKPTKNYGTKTSLAVQGPPANATVENAYMQFDLSTLPSGTIGNEVSKATLTVWVNKVKAAGSIDVFRVTSAWTESDITEGTAPSLDGSPEASGVTIAATDSKTFKSVDVTQLVKDWLNGGLTNDGIALVANAAGVSAQFDSKESTSTSHPPELDIELGTVANFSGSLSGDVTGTQGTTRVGRINGTLLGSLAGVTRGQVLGFTGLTWAPSDVVNSLTAGSGLSLSGSTGNVTASVLPGGVSNSMLANSNVTVTAGTGLGGGGTVALGGSTTLTNAGVLSVGASAPLASSGGQTPSVSLTGTVPVANGGTGAGTAPDARSNLGAAASGDNLDIVSLKGASDYHSNTAVGARALHSNATGRDNTAAGADALYSNTGNGNTAAGAEALLSNTTGFYNTAAGAGALYLNTTGYYNTAAGANALFSNISGYNNIALGMEAGFATTGGYNIDIGNRGVAAEWNTIRIGTVGTQTATYIAGISGATSSGGVAVYVNSSGQLGTATSSARFKEDIKDMGDSTSGLMKLRPVRFRYKPDIDPSGLEQYGLVAEEVAKVYRDLVVYDDKGQPQTVRYHFVNAMLLNEVQKQARQIEAQKLQLTAQEARFIEQSAHMERQQEQIDLLTSRLLQVEAVLGAQRCTPALEASYRKQPDL